jgi:plastocyanin
LVAVLCGAALVCAAPALAAPSKKTVKVGDNFFAPKSLTVDRNATITWKWPGADEAGDVHDVALTRGPKGVKKFQSEAAATDYTYRRKLTKSGTYKLVCTLHEEMRMTIRVRK